MLKSASMAIIYISCMVISFYLVKIVAFYFGAVTVLIAFPIAFMMFLVFKATKRELEGEE